jgi:hypothetical protein
VPFSKKGLQPGEKTGLEVQKNYHGFAAVSVTGIVCWAMAEPA